MNLDYAKIKEAAKNYEKDMTKFLRDIVKFPGESCDEKAHIDRIAEEMTKLGFDKVDIDPMGNVLGYMGTGETLIGFDAHRILLPFHAAAHSHFPLHSYYPGSCSYTVLLL